MKNYKFLIVIFTIIFNINCMAQENFVANNFTLNNIKSFSTNIDINIKSIVNKHMYANIIKENIKLFLLENNHKWSYTDNNPDFIINIEIIKKSGAEMVLGVIFDLFPFEVKVNLIKHKENIAMENNLRVIAPKYSMFVQLDPESLISNLPFISSAIVAFLHDPNYEIDNYDIEEEY